MQRGLGWYFARTALLFVIFFWFGIIVGRLLNAAKFVLRIDEFPLKRSLWLVMLDECQRCDLG